MIHEIVNDLRDCAHRCQRVARARRNEAASRLLEELGVLLMERALELEQMFDR
jgi:hypothetical protein